MKSVVRNIMYAAMSSALLFTAASCEDDRDEELLAIQSDRLLSVVDLEVKVRNKVEVVVTWKQNAQTKSFDLELYKGSSATGTPIQATNTADNTYTFKGLLGEETYYVQVRGVGEPFAPSKWMGDFVTTDAEQMMYEVDMVNDVTAHEATLRWPAGEAADSVIWSTENVEVGRRAVTADEIANGELTLTDLLEQKTYEVILRKEGRTRGSVEFKTLMDLGGAFPVYAGDDLKALLDSTELGNSFVIIDPDTFKIGTYALNRSIEIKGFNPGQRPIICGAITSAVEAEFKASAVIFEGQYSMEVDGVMTDKQEGHFFDAKDAVNLSINLDGCEFRNYQKGQIYNNSKAIFGDIIMNDCVVRDCKGDGGDFFDLRGGELGNLTVTNSTFMNGSRAFVRMQSTLSGSVTFSNCTFYNIAMSDNSNNTGLFRVENGNTVLENLYIIEMPTTDALLSSAKYAGCLGRTDKNKGTWTVNNVYYYNCPNLLSQFVPEGFAPVEKDPIVKDASKGDLTITNFDLKGVIVGDPRWYFAD